MVEPAEPGSGSRLDDIFLAALEIDPARRLEFLDTSCGEDDALRAEIEAMLCIADSRPDLLSPPDIGLIPKKLGRYEIVAECGRGAMGIVFKAKDTILLRTVAVKVLPQYLSRIPRNLERFTREAQTLAGLNHPNIATLYSLEESDGFHFLSMEFVPGVTLAEILARKSLSPAETLSLGLQVTMAMESAHAMGICHCDLKPANIMVAPDGKISLLDFGIARAFEHFISPTPLGGLPITRTTLSRGTPGYMAPEQATGQPVDERSDMWALGVILGECLTGERLLNLPEDDAAAWHDHLPAGTPPVLVALLRQCLVVDPRQRLGSVATARRQIENELKNHSRRPWIMAVAGSLVLVVAIIFQLGIGRRPTGPLNRLKMDQPGMLTGLDGQGKILWAKGLDTPLSRATIIKSLPSSATGDPGDRPLGCAIALGHSNGRDILEFLGADKGQLLWSHEPAWTEPVNAIGPTIYRWLVASPWPGRNRPVILGGIRDGPWYGFAVEAIDLSGKILGVYHHPGPLPFVQLVPARNGAPPEILLAGANSSARFVRRLVPFKTQHHPGCVVMLDAPGITGQAFPYSENLPEKRDWPGLARAREKSYLLIPLLSPDFDSLVDHVGTHDPGVGYRGFSAKTRDGRFILVDEELYPRQSIIARNTPADSLFRTGQAANIPFLYIHDGKQEWVDVPMGY